MPGVRELPALPELPAPSANVEGIRRSILGAPGGCTKGNGRKNKSFPKRDWNSPEAYYVCGEVIDGKRIFPTAVDVSKRFDISLSTLRTYAAENEWSRKRFEFQTGKYTPDGAQPIAKIESTDPSKTTNEDANPRPRATGDPQAILEKYLVHFEEAVDQKLIKRESMADVERAIRLLAFVKGQADSHKKITVVHTLDELARKHASVRAHATQIEDNGVAGVIGVGSPAQGTTEVMQPDGTVVHVAHDEPEGEHEDAAE